MHTTQRHVHARGWPAHASAPRVCTQIVHGGAGAESSAHTGGARAPDEPDPSTVRRREQTMLRRLGRVHNTATGDTAACAWVRTMFGPSFGGVWHAESTVFGAVFRCAQCSSWPFSLAVCRTYTVVAENIQLHFGGA